MPKETKVIQTRPGEEEYAIKRNELFGWEVLSNQRCQEKQKEGDGWYVVIFNRITFTRDKDAPWYKRVCELEKEFNDISNREYEVIKDKYRYDGVVTDKIKVGEKPKEFKLPKLAEPEKFFKWMILFAIGTILFLFSMALVKSSGEEGYYALVMLGFILGAVGLIKSIPNAKYLEGLSGEKKKEAVETYAIYKEEKRKYDDAVEGFFNKRIMEISKELENLLN